VADSNNIIDIFVSATHTCHTLCRRPIFDILASAENAYSEEC